MRRIVLLAFCAALVAAPATAKGAPLGPLRIATMRDGMGPSGPYGLAIDASGRAWTVIRPNGEAVFAIANGQNVNRGHSAGEDTVYATVFQMPNGAILLVADKQGTIYTPTGSHVQVAEPVFFQSYTPVGGPFGAWFWRHDEAGSGLGLITPGGRVQYAPRTFSSNVPAYVLDSDTTGVWISLRRSDGANEVVRIDASGSREIARFGVTSIVLAETDPQGRLVILERTGRRSSLKRVQADGQLRPVARLPADLRGSAIAIDGRGVIWIADYGVPRLVRVTPSGDVRSITVAREDAGHIRELAVAGDDVWFTIGRSIRRLVTTPGVCVVPDVRGMRVGPARDLVRSAGCVPTGTRHGTLVVRQSQRPGRILRARGEVPLTSGPRRHLLVPAACHIGRTTPVVARGKRRFVTFTAGEDGRRGAVWEACDARTGRRTLLARAPADTLAGSERLFDFSFAGTRVAYADLFGDRGGSNLWVRLTDIATGKRVLSAHVASSDGFGPTFPRLLRLITDGTRLLYLVRDPAYRFTPDGSIPLSYEQLILVSAAGSRTIDEGPVGAITDIRIGDGRVTWTRDGRLRQAPSG